MASKRRIFIDGQAGTTGLRIRDLLASRDDLELLAIDPARRKDPSARAEMLNRAEVSILCLPDDAAREAVRLVESPNARLLDASSAHRVEDGWVYGLPELTSEQRSAIATSTRVSNPGCWPTCALLLLRPLRDAGLLAADAPIAIHGVSGYSGGGHNMITKWEDPSEGLQALPFEAPYALERRHKHVPEMTRYALLAHEPVFMPAVGPFRCGMRVQIPLHASLLARGANAQAVFETLRARYAHERFVSVEMVTAALAERALDPRACNDRNDVRLSVLAHPSGHVVLCAVLDNLGKGAAGAAVQNLNWMLGLPEDRGLL